MSCHLMIGVLLCVGWAYMCKHSTYVYVCVSMTLYVRMCAHVYTQHFVYVCIRLCMDGVWVPCACAVLCIYKCMCCCVLFCVVVCYCWLYAVGCVVCCVLCCVLCVVLCVVYNITKLTCPLAVSGDGVPHELPSVSVSM